MKIRKIFKRDGTLVFYGTENTPLDFRYMYERLNHGFRLHNDQLSVELFLFKTYGFLLECTTEKFGIHIYTKDDHEEYTVKWSDYKLPWDLNQKKDWYKYLIFGVMLREYRNEFFNMSNRKRVYLMELLNHITPENFDPVPITNGIKISRSNITYFIHKDDEVILKTSSFKDINKKVAKGLGLL